MICSLPYAVEEIASQESTPSATGFDNFSCSSCDVINGFPRKPRLHMSEKDDRCLCGSSKGVVTRHIPYHRGMNSPKPNSLIAPCLFALTVRHVLVSKDTVCCQEYCQDIPSELFGRNKNAWIGNKCRDYCQEAVSYAVVVPTVCELGHFCAFAMCRNRDGRRRGSVARCWRQQKPCTAVVLGGTLFITCMSLSFAAAHGDSWPVTIRKSLSVPAGLLERPVHINIRGRRRTSWTNVSSSAVMTR